MDNVTCVWCKEMWMSECECTLLWKDACYLNKRPTIMCLARQTKRGGLPNCRLSDPSWTVETETDAVLPDVLRLASCSVPHPLVCLNSSTKYNTIQNGLHCLSKYGKFAFWPGCCCCCFFVCVCVLQLYCPIWTSPMRNSGCFPRGKPAATESRYIKRFNKLHNKIFIRLFKRSHKA